MVRNHLIRKSKDVAYYQWAEKDKEWLGKFQTSLSRLNKTYFTVVAGDFNLPGWNWKDNIIKLAISNHVSTRSSVTSSTMQV